MKFKIIRNDISNMEADAIVLPANSLLKIGSGTSKAIFDKAGRKELEEACGKIGHVKVGHTVRTDAYGLKASHLLHAVVPKWKNGKYNEFEKLSEAYLSTLILADDLGCQSIAIPLLGSGNNGFDLEIAFEIAKESIGYFEPYNKLNDIYLVVYSTEVVTMLKNQGVYVEEYIDGMYVSKKDERYVTPVQKVLERGKNVASLFVADGMEHAMEYADKALMALEEPENRKKIEWIAMQCVQVALQKKIPGKLDKLIKTE